MQKKLLLGRGLNLQPLDPLKLLTSKTHWAMESPKFWKLLWKWTIYDHNGELSTFKEGFSFYYDKVANLYSKL